uniref:Uncharacterized protein n=1 Tax=Cyanistes caeruleus TaxID=156563 RepID=A0A8C0UI25_CYACU
VLGVNVCGSSLQFHFLQTLEHRTDVSVTSTSLWWEAPEEQGVPWVPHWTPTLLCPMCSQDLAVLGCAADVLPAGTAVPPRVSWHVMTELSAAGADFSGAYV